MPVPPLSGWGRHVLVLSASPEFNSVVHGPDVPIRLHFNTKIDPKHSRLVLFGPDGEKRDLVPSDQRSKDILVSLAKGLVKGSYVLRWHVVESGGHVAEGEVAFRVETGR